MDPYFIESEDWHTAGEPFRIVKTLPPALEVVGQTVAQRRLNIMKVPGHPLDLLRQSLCHEPRGHADMYGGFITPPNDSGAQFGVLFWHKDGFSTACGHGTIALGYWAVAQALVPIPKDGVVDIVIDVPSGRVISSVSVRNSLPVHAEFINVLSYQLAKNVGTELSSLGLSVNIDLAFAGAVYASLDVSQLGLRVEPSNHIEFIRLAREIKASLGERAHYGGNDLYCIIFFEDQEEQDETQRTSEKITQRNVTVFADGQIDRSPCGSGSCARLAILLSQGRFQPNQSRFVNRSIIGTSFEADIIEELPSPVTGFRACIPRVRGQANLIGYMKFFIDPSEIIFPGFLLR